MRRAFARILDNKIALPPYDVTLGLIVVVILWITTLYVALKFLIR
jgi:hypothetical protein